MHYAPTRSKGAIDPTKQKRWDNTLEDYAKERKMGNQPATTRRTSIEEAKRISDLTGQPYISQGR